MAWPSCLHRPLSAMKSGHQSAKTFQSGARVVTIVDSSTIEAIAPRSKAAMSFVLSGCFGRWPSRFATSSLRSS